MGSDVKKVVRKAGNVFSGSGLGGKLKKGSSKLMSTVSKGVSDVTGLDDKWANIVTAATVSAVGGIAGGALGGIGANALGVSGTVGATVGAASGTMAGAQASMAGVKETAKEQKKEAERSQAETEQKAKKIRDDKAIKIKREELAKQSSVGRRGRNRTYLGSQGTISEKSRLGD